jgi:hypothetical protein
MRMSLSRKAVPRAGLLKAALAGKIMNVQSAQALHLSVRQFQRLKVRVKANLTEREKATDHGQPNDEVVTCDQAEPWTFGAGALMANLARRGLLAGR